VCKLRWQNALPTFVLVTAIRVAEAPFVAARAPHALRNIFRFSMLAYLFRLRVDYQ
jgi:hypothetical protein